MTDRFDTPGEVEMALDGVPEQAPSVGARPQAPLPRTEPRPVDYPPEQAPPDPPTPHETLRSKVPRDIFAASDGLAELKDAKDNLASALKAVNADIAAHEDVLNEMMIEAELPRFHRKGFTFFVSTKTYVRAAGGVADPALAAWLRENGYANLVEAKVNANSLRSAVKEIVDAYGSVPPDLEPLIITDEVPTVQMRKGQ